jgi:hypothetical protein
VAIGQLSSKRYERFFDLKDQDFDDTNPFQVLSGPSLAEKIVRFGYAHVIESVARVLRDGLAPMYPEHGLHDCIAVADLLSVGFDQAYDNLIDNFGGLGRLLHSDIEFLDASTTIRNRAAEAFRFSMLDGLGLGILSSGKPEWRACGVAVRREAAKNLKSALDLRFGNEDGR